MVNYTANGIVVWPLKEINKRRVKNVENSEVKNAKLKGKCKLKKNLQQI